MSKKASARVVSVFIVFAVICSMLSVQAFAATDYFSGMTGKMNALGTANGGASAAWNISSGSISSINAKVTNVTLNVTVSSGSSPFYIYVKSPFGSIFNRYVGSTSVTFSEFSGENPKGTWQVWIVTTGTVSTATATMKVNYSY